VRRYMLTRKSVKRRITPNLREKSEIPKMRKKTEPRYASIEPIYDCPYKTRGSSPW